jgi:hypothetical protein
VSADAPSGHGVSMIHEQYVWPRIPGLTLDHVIALGRCGTPESFYDMLQAGQEAKGQCPFCERARLKGTILHSNDHAYVFTPPGTFNRHEGALRHKYVIVLDRHTADISSLSDAEVLAMQDCRRWLKENRGCYSEDSGGMSYTRHGSTIFNAGTVIGHLHENVDEPNGLAEIRPPVYKDDKGWRKDYDRLQKYLVAYAKGMTREEFLQSYSMHHDYQY